jgi:hypothetical protein
LIVPCFERSEFGSAPSTLTTLTPVSSTFKDQCEAATSPVALLLVPP